MSVSTPFFCKDSSHAATAAGAAPSGYCSACSRWNFVILCTCIKVEAKRGEEERGGDGWRHQKKIEPAVRRHSACVVVAAADEPAGNGSKMKRCPHHSLAPGGCYEHAAGRAQRQPRGQWAQHRRVKGNGAAMMQRWHSRTFCPPFDARAGRL